MIIGYARISTAEQDPAAQVDALTAAGAERVFSETASGARRERPELIRLLDQLRPGDVILVWKLDRLSRSVIDQQKILDQITAAGATFRSVTENLDTQGAAGRMMLSLLSVFAAYERDIIIERTRSGLDRARKNGRVGGRPSKLSIEQKQEIIEAVRSGRKTASDMARLFRVHPSTIARLFSNGQLGSK